MMVATRQMVAAKQRALPATTPARTAPTKRARSGPRAVRAKVPRSAQATPVRRNLAEQLLCSSATSVAPNGNVQPEKLDARVSLRRGMRQLEENLYEEGFTHVVGVDEAGRGPLVRHIPSASVACVS